MAHFFTATFEDGVLKPHEPLSLLPHSQVRVAVEILEDEQTQLQRREAWDTLEQLWQHSQLDSGGERLTREQLHERR
jgi:predicted DNA-binding antitoxin AbrB/MazE fold protein